MYATTLHLPLQACFASSGGRNRTYGLLLQRQATLPAASTPECFFLTQECPVGIEPTSPAWKAGTFAARPRARKAAEAGIEPASRRLTVAFPYQHRTHRIIVKSGRLDLNQRSRAPEARAPRILAKLSHVLKMRPAGIEPTHPAWQAGRLPLHHGRMTLLTKLSKIRDAKRSFRAPGRTRTDVAALRKRSLGR